MSGIAPPVTCDSRASTRVERAKSGAPDRPPASSRAALRSPSRASVVLVAMIPATPASRATPAISSAPRRQVRRDLEKDGDGPEQRIARLHHAREQRGQRLAPCKSRSFSVLGLLTFTVAKSRCAPQW